MEGESQEVESTARVSVDDVIDSIVLAAVDPARLTTTALTVVPRVLAAWGLDTGQADELAGGPYPDPAVQHPLLLTQHQVARASLIVGIYEALHRLFDGELADAWVGRPNSNALFAGATPLAFMLAGGIPAMLSVRSLLDSRAAGLG